MINLNELVRENVRNLTPYSCARDEFKGDAGVFLDANENPYGNLNRYPDPYQRELKTAISRLKGVEEEKIFLGNGSDEIIDLTFRIFCNPGTDKALLFTPTYGMYEVSASVNDIKTIKIPLSDTFQLDIERIKQNLSDNQIKVAFICSPNNPSGNSMNYHDVEFLIANFNGIVLIDEAYIDFSDKQSIIRLIDKFDNLVVMQTFSKAFGLASVRVGMAFSNPGIIHYYNKMKPPYNISSINQKAVLDKLKKNDEYKEQVTQIKEEKSRLMVTLSKLKIVEKVYPSDANFVLVKVSDANFIYNTLVDGGIIVRNRNNVVEKCLRITVGTPAENRKLIQALKAIEI